MVTCPKCGKLLKVEVERIYIQTVLYEYKKNGKGIKKPTSNFQGNLTDIDLRIFFKCEECFYSTDNLNSIEGDYTELSHCKDEVDFIINQIYDMC